MNILVQRRRRAAHLFAAASLVLAAPCAMAQVYKCQSAQGGVEYRSIPCDGNATQKVVQGGRSSVSKTPVQTAEARTAEPDDAQRQSEARLQRSCNELQTRVSAAQRFITSVERSLRDTGARGAVTPSSNDSAEMQRALQQERYRIASAQRQAEADKCDKVGIVVGAAPATAN